MKRILCIVITLSMIAAIALTLGGCGDENKSGSASKPEATKAPETKAVTEAASTAPTTAQEYTLAPDEDETEAASEEQETEEATEEQATEEDEDSTENGEYYGNYGGLTGQEAILKALGYAGAGYQCVSYDKQYLQNKEAWCVGVQATDGSDDTVYYLYVNADQVVPVDDIPDLDGGNSGSYAGISEDEAISKALGMRDDNCSCVSSEQSGVGGEEYWRIGIQSNDDPDGEIYYYLVNGNTCIPE